MKRFYPHGFHKTDRQGRPIYIERVGHMDAASLLAAVSFERILEYVAYDSERSAICRLPACSLVRGRLVESSLQILDFDGVGFRSLTNSTVVKIARTILQEQERQFPEMTGKTILVNVPTFFSIVWRVLKPLMSPATATKIEVIGVGMDYQKRLKELITPENLPTFLGGECTCAEEGGCLYSDAGPWSDPVIKGKLEDTPFWEVLRRFTAEIDNTGVLARSPTTVDSGAESDGAVNDDDDIASYAFEDALSEPPETVSAVGLPDLPVQAELPEPLRTQMLQALKQLIEARQQYDEARK